MTNIPIYRAKKIGSDEYVIGYLDIQKSWETKCLSCNSLDTESYYEYYSEECKCNNCGKDLGFHDDNWEHGHIGKIQYLIRNNGEYGKIDPSTLSIHFNDMIDSQGNKIFASLNEDGKGGDVIENYNFNNDYKKQISIYDNCKLCLVDKDGDTYCLDTVVHDGIKAIGIQK